MAKLIVGVTGGIGSGKSAVMRAFEALGVDAVDADAMARLVVEPGQPALADIARHFGAEILTPTGELNRAALRAIIFSDPEAKQWLEGLLHPLINSALREHLAAAQSPYALLVSPLLFETGQDALVDRVLVVDAPEALQLARASQRDGADPTQIGAIMASQMPREDRLAKADEVILNDGLLAQLAPKVATLHKHYLHLTPGPFNPKTNTS